MHNRIPNPRRRNLSLADIQAIIRRMGPLDGAPGTRATFGSGTETGPAMNGDCLRFSARPPAAR